MTPNLQKLVDIASKPLLPILYVEKVAEWLNATGVSDDLVRLLTLKNGFYAFESALHVFPFSRDNWFDGQDLQRWNARDLWKHAYGESPVLDRLVAFAEDAVGVQFCFSQGQIVRFDPETGELEEMCSTLDQWAEMLLSDYEFELAYPLAHAWQQINGPILQGNRLVPILPLIAEESSFEPTNFYQLDAVKSMLFRADIAGQLKSIPDGQKVGVKIGNVRR